MKPGAKKIALGKTMRVATVFTGAAACAAAFAPTAHAAAGHQARSAGKTLAEGTTLTAPRPGMMRAFQPESNGNGFGIPLSGQISVELCTTTPKYVHLKDEAAYICAGHEGTWAFGPIYPAVSEICGGNNSGTYWNSKGQHANFGPGTTYAHLPWPNTVITQIKITHYGGNDECPAP